MPELNDHQAEARRIVQIYVDDVRSGRKAEEWIAPTWRESYTRGKVGSGMRELLRTARKVTVGEAVPPQGLRLGLFMDVRLYIDHERWELRVIREAAPDKTDPEAPYGIIPTSLRMTRP